jgi:hypothetical protein
MRISIEKDWRDLERFGELWRAESWINDLTNDLIRDSTDDLIRDSTDDLIGRLISNRE